MIVTVDNFNMDLVSVATMMAQDKIMTQANVSILKKSLDGAELQAQGLMKILDSAAPLPAGSGTLVDTFA